MKEAVSNSLTAPSDVLLDSALADPATRLPNVIRSDFVNVKITREMRNAANSSFLRLSFSSDWIIQPNRFVIR